MRTLPTLVLGVLAGPIVAQACTGPAAPRTFASQDPFGADFFFGPAPGTQASCNLLFDLEVQVPIAVSAMRGTTYDQGVLGTQLPDQVGATAAVNVWTIPTTHVGAHASTAAWTLVATGTLTVTAWPAAAPIAFAAPFALPAGTFGVAIEMLPTTAATSPHPGSLHPLGMSPDPTPVAGDQFVTMRNEGIQQVGWGAAAPSVAGIDLEFDYTADPGAAHWQPFGSGCYSRPRGFYEVFSAANPAPDLAHSAIALQPVGTGANRHYAAAASAVAYVAPAGTPRNAAPPAAWPAASFMQWDDALDTPVVLPFVFDFPGGSTSVVTAASNGQLMLAAVNDGEQAWFFGGDVASLQGAPPRFAPFFGDLDLEPGSATTGGLYYETDNATWARISWHHVAEYAIYTPGSLMSFQVTLWSDGHVDLVYDALSMAAADALAGFLDLGGAPLPAGPIDLSASLPFTSGDGAVRPVLGLDARPVLGTTFVAATSAVAVGTGFEFLTTAFAGAPAPLDLAAYGMPGCALQLDAAQVLGTALVGLAPSQRFEFPVALPNAAAFFDVQLVFQGAPLTPGFNAAGVLVTNGVCARLGN